MKKVIYTCITGGYDDVPQHPYVAPGWDYVLFSDNKDLIRAGKIHNWNVRPLAFKKCDTVRNARWHKVNAHILFPEYDYSLWIDGNISIARPETFKLIDGFIRKQVDVVVPIHPHRNCIYAEAAEIIRQHIDFPRTVHAEMKYLRRQKYPKNNGLSETNILLRRHNNIGNALDMWWNMINTYSKRDQLSFNYVMWANNIAPVPLYDDGGAGTHRNGPDFIFKYGDSHTQAKIPPYEFYWITRETTSNGRRHIYLFGKKILSYKLRYAFDSKKFAVFGKNNKVILMENGRERFITSHKRIRGLDIHICGDNNTVILHAPINAQHSSINIQNDNAYVEIGSSPNLAFLQISCKHGRGQICKIGDGTTVYGANIKLSEESGCFIGRDCMMSNSINIWATDGHSVLDAKTKQPINITDRYVRIDDHVWICEGVRITKKAHIHHDSIVGGGAVAYRDYKTPGVVIAGNPGEIVKRDITWNRQAPYALTELYQSQIDMIPHIDKQILDKEIVRFKSIGIRKTKGAKGPRIIVSLTSFPQRMADIHYTIYSLLNQSVRPDMVVLWLGADKFPRRERDLPKSLLALCKNGLTIKWVRDMRSYTKLIPSLTEFPDDIIITVDDDIYYPDYLVERLYAEYEKRPNMIHCMRAHKIKRNFMGKILPYNKWKHEIKNVSPAFDNFLTGVGGVLYPPHSLCPDVLKSELFTKLSPAADDIWFWAMAVKNRTRINVVKSDFQLTYVNPARELRLTGEVTLATENLGDNKNDVQMRDVVNYFGIKL